MTVSHLAKLAAWAFVRALGVGAITALGLVLPVHAQSLAVAPVNLEMAAGQMTASITITNAGATQTAIQVRTFKWAQGSDGGEELTKSEEVVASPPISTIAPGASQLVRLVVRTPAQSQEATYRIVIDQIPLAADAGTVRIALRLLIPVFVEPALRVEASVRFHIERDDSGAALVAVNDGGRHETLRDLILTTGAGDPIALAAVASPHLLAGATQRWRILTSSSTPEVGGVVHLAGRATTGAIDQQIAVVAP